MADRLTSEARSRNMSRVRSHDTEPERTVRRLLHAMGYRFRLRRKDLPGRPDIVLPKFRSVIFVHGCFWHGHAGCRAAARPTTRPDFWNHKLDENIRRDARVQQELIAQDWRVLVVWQCELRDMKALELRLREDLRPITALAEETGGRCGAE